MIGICSKSKIKMKFQELSVDGLVSDMRADIDMGHFSEDHRKSSGSHHSSGHSGSHSNSHSSNHSSSHASYEADILFTFTSLTRWFLQNITELSKRLKSTKTFRVLTRTTQPIHIISILLVAIFSVIFFPVDRKQSNLLVSRFTHLTYFTAFSLHVGSQFWMTFVSGLSLYFNLGRHAFGDVQKILFPRYFAFNCVLSAVTVVQFTRLHASTISQWDLQMYLQVITLSLCVLVEFCVRILYVPSVLEMISQKTVIEKAAGIGQEVGHYNLGPLLNCPHYMALHRSFRRAHMHTAIGNITTIMCSAFHLYFLACRGVVQIA